MDFVNLYHGTWNMYFPNIVKEKCIKNCLSNVSEATEAINNLILKIVGRNLREGAIYLTPDFKETEGFEITLTVPILKLDSSYLFVADNILINNIYIEYMSGTTTGDVVLREMINDYKKSFLSYKEYIELNLKYKTPEFLYFKNISLDTLINEEDFELAKVLGKEYNII